MTPFDWFAAAVFANAIVALYLYLTGPDRRRARNRKRFR